MTAMNNYHDALTR